MNLDDPTAVALHAADALGRAGIEHALYGGLLLGGADATGLNTLDLVEPCSIEYARRALTRSLGSTLRSQPIRLLTTEDFVVFKVLSTRELDLDDARSVLTSLGTEIDRGLIGSEVATLEREGPGHPISERWRRVLGPGRADPR